MLLAVRIHCRKIVMLLFRSLEQILFCFLPCFSRLSSAGFASVNLAGIYMQHRTAHSSKGHSYGIGGEVYITIVIVLGMLLYLVSKDRELSLRLFLENRFFSRRLFSVCSIPLELVFGIFTRSTVF